jgi:hypothetical protein
MAGTASIFRIDSNGDTESDARTANQIVEFNGTSLNPDDRSFVESLEVHYINDISIHPNPNRHLSQIQDGKLGLIELTIKGSFTTPDSATAIARFNNWMIQDKTNSSLVYGRFGLRYDNMSQLDLTPSTTIGYILYDFIVKDVEEFQNKAVWEARLYRNGAI